ncbi:jasmonoyl--L-amino acid synthetase JAR4 isoform X2 [Neltuma alba]|uniref:jasmonoyl--L-amino acid synthetase JAR4 isoform X2 n=1 Tax=Neltuma alba TaxID=207710 RepID=UPI0010A4ADB7|nr:jasmonoyl--L-amino acid synthetase JAR4 isoform X2 [Prosopis alba]
MGMPLRSSGKPITTMSLSSGTTQGKPKYVPWNDELFETTMQIYQTSFAFRNREFPIKNGKALSFIYSSKQFKTKGGLAAGTATTNVYRNAQYKRTMKALQSQCCSPDEVIFGPDFHQSLYCHLLCGLIFREEVQLVSSTFAHSIVHAFRTFEQVWEELCTDIREGVLSSRVTAPSIRMAMSKLLKPNPELANLIVKKCMGLSNWYGLIPELFPNTKYIHGIMTGSMEPYLKKLRHYAGELPLVTAEYGSSEGWIAANVNPKLPPESATYAVLPHIGYFEFIPLTELEQTNFLCVDPQPVGLTEVKVGEEYEIVVTNPAGLYRYRLGDVVKVMGFHNSTPELKFVRRSSLLLTINIDKNTEKDLQLAVEAAAKLVAGDKLEVVDYTSHVDVSTDPGHYVIFWEINGEASEELLGECCNCLDKSFVDAGYVSSRKVNWIGPLELRVVRGGTFQKILDHFLGLGAAVSQYKTPRCVGPTHGKVLQILNENVVKSYLSTAFN